MKKVMTLVIVGLVLVSLTACGGSKGGHCDAYGSVDAQEQNKTVAND